MVTRVTKPLDKTKEDGHIDCTRDTREKTEDRMYRLRGSRLKSPSKSVALHRKAIVPVTNEVGKSLANDAASKSRSRAHQVSPGVDLGPADRDRPEVHPLLHRIAVYMVDPGHQMRRSADGNHMVHHRSHRVLQLDIHVATRHPGLAQPADIAVEVRKSWPHVHIGKDFPRQLAVGPGHNRVFDPQQLNRLFP